MITTIDSLFFFSLARTTRGLRVLGQGRGVGSGHNDSRAGAGLLSAASTQAVFAAIDVVDFLHISNKYMQRICWMLMCDVKLQHTFQFLCMLCFVLAEEKLLFLVTNACSQLLTFEFYSLLTMLLLKFSLSWETLSRLIIIIIIFFFFVMFFSPPTAYIHFIHSFTRLFTTGKWILMNITQQLNVGACVCVCARTRRWQITVLASAYCNVLKLIKGIHTLKLYFVFHFSLELIKIVNLNTQRHTIGKNILLFFSR